MSGKAMNLNELSVQLHALDSPEPEEIAAVLQKKLSKNFDYVQAEAVACPNLTQEPFNLAGEGLGGNPVVIEIGGPAYLLPLVDREKCYDMNTIPALVGDEKCFVIGAGAGPWPYVGVNSEGIINVVMNRDGVVVPGTRIVKIDENQKTKMEIAPSSENKCCLLANLFCSRGETCKVVKVHCKKRTGKLDFITSMRLALAEAFPDKVIGMGGVFVLLRGQVRQHVMPDFSKTPIESDEGVEQWLKFFNMSAPLSAVGTFVTKDPGLDLRLQHFHSFGKTEGGHYHNDTTPEDVEYLAIMATACTLARVDPPPNAVPFGKD